MSDHDTSASHTVTHTEFEKEVDTRWGQKNPGAAWLIALLGIPLLLAALAAWSGHGAIEGDLGKASLSAAASAQIPGLDVAALDGAIRFSGRDATINVPEGVDLSAADLEKLKAAVAEVDGVRSVNVVGAGASAGASADPSASPSEGGATDEGDECVAAVLQGSIDEAIGTDKVLFAKFKAGLSPAGKAEVAAAAEYLAVCPNVAVEVTGNINKGAPDSLAVRRAESVKKALVAAGLSADSITTASAGTSAPQGGPKLNRYVNITVK